MVQWRVGFKRMRTIAAIFLCLSFWASAAARGAEHQVRVPLEDGRLSVATLTQGLARLVHVPALAVDSDASINLGGLRGMIWVKAFNAALGRGCRIDAEPDALVLSADPQQLPGTIRGVKRAVRLFTAAAAPRATAAQRRTYGLLLPQQLSQSRPLVVLVHGLDCDGSDWGAMAALLQKADYQVAYFRYPNDQPLEQSAAAFTDQMRAVRETFPKLTVDVVTHSMGALVARAYVEGKQYAGGVRHLVLIAPPNHGSPWAILRPILEVHEHYELWRHNPDWHWTWMITDGLGAAGSDLEPGSSFLKGLNDQPRRPGVRYTIIAGSHTPWQQWEARGLQAAQACLPDPIAGLWGIRQCRRQVRQWAKRIVNQNEKNDGVVSIQSAALAGVSDLVILPVDHESLYRAPAGDPSSVPPAAWPTLADRLEQ
jgi:pimeloyl-ACP methyl ester carboxylesterase